MEHASYTTRTGVDVGYHGSALHPANGEGRVGKRGIDKTFTLKKVMALAYHMDEKPNIIIKAGPNAKWYIKKCHPDALEREIEKQKWRNVSRCTMYVINWTPRAAKEAAKEGVKKPAKEAKKPIAKEAKKPIAKEAKKPIAKEAKKPAKEAKKPAKEAKKPIAKEAKKPIAKEAKKPAKKPIAKEAKKPIAKEVKKTVKNGLEIIKKTY